MGMPGIWDMGMIWIPKVLPQNVELVYSESRAVRTWGHHLVPPSKLGLVLPGKKKEIARTGNSVPKKIRKRQPSRVGYVG